MRERILIIEDDDRILQFIRRGLTYEGYQVETAEDGPSGLASARDMPPDLVVLDWMLPGMDGLEVCRRLRAAGDTPVLMLTAKDSVPDRVEGLDAGADDYLDEFDVISPYMIEINPLKEIAHNPISAFCFANGAARPSTDPRNRAA